MDREKLIVDNLGLVKGLAGDYYHYVPTEMRGMLSYDDLVSAGIIALINAIDNYDDRRDVKLSTYAYKGIKHAINNELYMYIGGQTLYLDNEKMANVEAREETDSAASFDLKSIQDLLYKTGMSEEEIAVYCMAQGLGRQQIKNVHRISRELNIPELQVRRLKQSAERKIKKYRRDRV